MRHYECVVLFHPNQSERVKEMIERYKALVENEYSGVAHRMQDLDRKKLHYTIKSARASKAHFAIFNIELNDENLVKLKSNFRFNDAIMRSLIINRGKAITEKCPDLLEKEGKYTPVKIDRGIYKTNFKAEDIYLNIAFLREHVTETGRIMPYRITPASSKQQRQITRAVKLARYLGLMQYCDRHS